MFRTTLRRAALARPTFAAPSSRSIATAATKPKKSFFSSFTFRSALAAGIVYYYTTSAVFADEPRIYEGRPATDFVPTPEEERPKSRIDEVLAAKHKPQPTTPAAAADAPVKPADEAAKSSPQDLQDEADQQGAFNPETGEINWDCPCLGGMAHGPCGPEFKEAFSCFIYSQAEPKGVDCIDKFKNMQACFQQHPDVYGAEIDDDDEKTPEQKKAEEEGAARRAASEDQLNALDASVEETSSPAATGLERDVKEVVGEAAEKTVETVKEVAGAPVDEAVKTLDATVEETTSPAVADVERK